MAWSPLGSSMQWSREVLHGAVTTGIAQAHNRSAAQVALKWLLSHGSAVITKSSSPAHLSEDIDLFGWELTEQDMRELDAADFAKDEEPSFLCSDRAPRDLVV